jgi:signal transduction histidine kinase
MDNAQTNSSNWILNFITDKRWAFFRHLILILFIGLNFDIFNPSLLRIFAEKLNLPFDVFYIGQLVTMFFAIGLIYLNLYVLFPRYFQQGHYISYLLGLFFLLLILYAVSVFSQQIYINYFGKIKDYATGISVFDFLGTVMYPFVFLCSTTGYKIFKIWLVDQQRFAELEKEKLNAELNQLKTQVNPHFLFNTLNNLHVLTMTNPEKASEIILGLSDVLRYQIYDSQNDKVLLSKDIEIIRQYLDLEKIRRDNLWINLTVDTNLAGVCVPPLLFINFIDNAIKHSNTRGESSISISFQVKSDRLYFEISNSKSPIPTAVESNGFGLANVKKRLDLLYGSEHTLEIRDEADKFFVKLNFPI